MSVLIGGSKEEQSKRNQQMFSNGQAQMNGQNSRIDRTNTGSSNAISKQGGNQLKKRNTMFNHINGQHGGNNGL